MLPDRILVISIFVVASCGLAYELIAGALSSYLLGDSVLQFSTVIGCYLFAMGVGAHLSRYVREPDVLTRFIDIELAIGLLGGIAAALLFLTFAWLAAIFTRSSTRFSSAAYQSIHGMHGFSHSILPITRFSTWTPARGRRSAG